MKYNAVDSHFPLFAFTKWSHGKCKERKMDARNKKHGQALWKSCCRDSKRMIRYEKHLNLMDILSQYKQQHPEAFQEKTPARMSDEYGREYTGMVRWVVRLSGGRIRDARTASYFLLALAGVAAVIAFFL